MNRWVCPGLSAIFVVFFVSGQKAAAAQADYVGAARCGSCHPEKWKLQSASEHAHALSRPADHALAQSFASDKTFVRAGKYSFQFVPGPQQKIHVHAFDNTRQIDVPLEWAFGAGAQAVTFATQVNSEWYLEHAFSYYTAAHTYFITPGEPPPPEDTLPAALGSLYRSDGETSDIRHCFECHSTGALSRSDSGAWQPSELGVRCEACHGPGREHADAAARGDLARAKSSIGNPARLSSSELNTFCGRCHRQPAPAGSETDWKVAWNVRHQPVYLNQSECFRRSSGALSCVTCHEPHSVLETQEDLYNSKCLACHPRASHRAAALKTAGTRDCVGCHMPRVSPQSWLRFTNHWIGIYGTGNMLTPVRHQP